jgi:hypothetical protein
MNSWDLNTATAGGMMTEAHARATHLPRMCLREVWQVSVDWTRLQVRNRTTSWWREGECGGVASQLSEQDVDTVAKGRVWRNKSWLLEMGKQAVCKPRLCTIWQTELLEDGLGRTTVCLLQLSTIARTVCESHRVADDILSRV